MKSEQSKEDPKNSLVEYIGYSNGGQCGYCQRDETKHSSIAVWSFSISVSHYNGLLDRGMRRCGKYIYKPVIKNTCCPQYTIRLDANKFRLTRSQKRALRHMNDFLLKDIRPRVQLNKFASSVESKAINSNDRFTKTVVENSDQTRKKSGRKKKDFRRQRAFKKMLEKGIDIEEAQRKRKEKEESRRRTVHSFFIDYDPETFKHKLIVRLISVDSPEYIETFTESYALFEKYQKIVHNDTSCTKSSYRSFLADSPLFSDEKCENNCLPLGTYHQQYYIDEHLIAVGVLDILPRCLSAKYFYYDPDYEFLSLGTYSALREIAFTQELSKDRPQLRYYYMGFYIHSCRKMRYKGHFHPSDLLCDRSFTWVPLEKCLEMIEKFGERVEAFNPDAPVAETCSVESIRCLYQSKIMSYQHLLGFPGFKETEKFMEEYAQLVGPMAQEMLLHRN
ncbi:unnamed protein product [Thelazia callipaeda]|uniref:Arginyl-tRNA--protein transferase 1 n=1 Tax=Thelazia callipaeda TaxID=103827 RepID=A0A158RB00_THECL|nr:unnamed protein product [Thelazia callipaeda]